MKIFGNKSSGSHKRTEESRILDEQSVASPKFSEPEVRSISGEARGEQYASAEPGDLGEVVDGELDRKKRRRRIVWLCVAAALVLAVGAGAIWYKSAVKPPEIVISATPSPTVTVAPTETPMQTEEPEETAEPTPTPSPTPEPHDGDALIIDAAAERKEGCYTVLLLGEDQKSASTDTMIVATFDTVNHTINAVSIPRDTLVNVSWATKRINTLYSASNGDMEKVKTRLADVLGYKVDCYAKVDIEAFVKLVDAIDGVWFDVPVNMYYWDPVQNLLIDFDKGYQWLSGEDALKVVRFRSGYSNADIGRIDTQQAFLMTVAKQVLQLKNVTAIDDLAKIFNDYVETDLSLGNIIWFCQEFFEVESEDIHFATAPGNYAVAIKATSYVSLYVNEWLEMVNTMLNPYKQDVTVSNVNILYYDGGPKSTVGTIAGGIDSFYDSRPAVAPVEPAAPGDDTTGGGEAPPAESGGGEAAPAE